MCSYHSHFLLCDLAHRDQVRTSCRPKHGCWLRARTVGWVTPQRDHWSQLGSPSSSELDPRRQARSMITVPLHLRLPLPKFVTTSHLASDASYISCHIPSGWTTATGPSLCNRSRMLHSKSQMRRTSIPLAAILCTVCTPSGHQNTIGLCSYSFAALHVGDAAIAKLGTETGHPERLATLVVDTSKPKSIEAAAKKLEFEYAGRLGGLVSNAGVHSIQQDPAWLQVFGHAFHPHCVSDINTTTTNSASAGRDMLSVT